MNEFVKPYGARVLVKKVPHSEMQDGIYIPEAATKGAELYEVISVGDLVDINPGDKIMIGPFGGHKMIYQGEEYMYVKKDDILGVMNA